MLNTHILCDLSDFAKTKGTALYSKAVHSSNCRHFGLIKAMTIYLPVSWEEEEGLRSTPFHIA